jgi:Mg2+ and Co2+ transporter CorA
MDARTGAGEMTSSQKLPGLIFAFYFSSNGTIKELGINQAQADYNDGRVWLHFDSSDPNTQPSLDSIFSLPAPAKALLVAANERQQLYADEVCTYGALAELEGLDEDTKDIVFIPFAMIKDLFISASDRQLARLQSMRDVNHLKGKVSHGPTGLLERIVDQQLDDVDDYAENLAKRLDEIENSILVDGSGNQRQLIASVRRAAVRLHRQNAISQSLVHRIECEKNARLLRLASEMAQRLDWQQN